MKARQILLGTILFFSCTSTPNPTGNPPTEVSIKTVDSVSPSRASTMAKSVIIAQTRLQDTTLIKGNVVLFLRPDDVRFESYARGSDNIYEADSDFGIGISSTMDSIAKDKRYKGIQTTVSVKRYIVIENCKNGPRTIDRDTIDYGLILTAKGKEIKINTRMHSGDYLDDVDDYFKITNGRQTSISGQ